MASTPTIDPQIIDTLRRLAQTEIPKYQNEKFYGTLPRELFSSMAAIGVTGLTIAEEHGGLGSNPQTCAAVMEEIAAVDLGAAVFLSVHLMVAGLIQRYGSSEQKAHYLPRFADGSCLGAFALTEPSAGSDAANLRSRYTRSGHSIKLDGEKCYITSAGTADLYVVFARAEGTERSRGITAFLLPSDTKGLTIGKPEKKMGAELSPIASLTFTGATLQDDQILGTEKDGYRVALSGLAGGRVNMAACANGLSRTAIALALAHTTQRQQFGQALIDFQGLQFMLADMKIKLEASRLLVERAADLLGQDPLSDDARLFPSIAKCFATDSAMSVTTDAVQLLGGAGYIREYQVERLMRDAKMLQIVEGTNQIQRSLIARAMTKP